MTEQLETARQTEQTLRDQLQALQKQIIPTSSQATTKAERQKGIPADLRARLYNVLGLHSAFENDMELMATFTDARLDPWRIRIPSSNTLLMRVQSLVASLQGQYNARGENALLLFLRILADNTHPDDALHTKLTALIADLKPILEGTTM